MSSELPEKRIVAYYPGGKSTELDELPLTWLWDEYPLAPGSWGNIQAFYDGADSRPLIRKWIDRGTPVANPLPIYRPAVAPLPSFCANGGVRQCYAPTADDIERVRRLFPDHPRPEAPPWDEVATRLILAGHTQPDPAGIRASTLLALLEQTEAATPLRHRQGEGKADPGTQNTKDDYKTRLLSLYTNGVSDERILEAEEVLRNPSLSCNEKLNRLNDLMPIPPNASAEKLAETLDVSKQAVLKAKWWKKRMAKRRSEEAKDVDDRQSQLKERAQRWDHNRR